LSPEEARRIIQEGRARIQEDRARKILSAREAQEQEEYSKSLRGIITNKSIQIAGNVKDRIQSNETVRKVQDKTSIFVTAAADRTVKSGKFWIWFFSILAGGIFLLWKFKLLGKVIAYLIPIIIGILFLVIIVWGFRDKGENSRYIALAFIIWGVDLLPQVIIFGKDFLGPPYAGFKFEVIGLLNTNWVAVLFSIVFMVAFSFGTIRDLFKKNYWAVLISLGIFMILNRFFKDYLLTTLPFTSTWLNWGILGAIIITFVLAFQFRENLSEWFADYLTYQFLILTASFFWINDFWMSTLRAWPHVIFILVFGFVYIKSKEQDNPSIWHLLIPAFLIADFFVYNLVLLGSTVVADGLQFIPILILLVLWYCIAKTPESRYAFFSILFIFLIIVAFVLPTYTFASESTVFEARTGADYKEFYTQFKDKLKEIIEGRLDIATAGLYTGDVEKNRYESLGVYFANVRAADPQFYTDEPITVWGSIRSKTYKDAVIINFSCYRLKDNKRIRADRIVPNIKFPIFTLEEVDTECTFIPKTKGDIASGANTITLSADYNFGTDAYLKAYFIDRDRYRAYARENIDPFKEFGIKDTTPKSVSTNGPVEIGMSTGQSLITVSQGYAVKPFIGITLTNRKEIQDKDKRVITRWEGKIKNITELVLLVPPGVKLENDDGIDRLQRYCKSRTAEEYVKCPCNMPFYEYKIENCRSSCSSNVQDPCVEACKESITKQEEMQKCADECLSAKERCIDECDRLFQSEDGSNTKYKGYALDVGSLEFKDLNKDIDKHRSFQCRFDPSQNVLDNNPITTRYFRVRARYNYLLENSVSVAVTEPLQEVLSTAPSDITKLSTEIRPGSALWFDGFSTDLISAISLVETQWRHCCAESGKNKAGSCKASEDTSCGADRILTSYAASKAGYYSIGMMQVQSNPANQELAKPPICKEGQTIYDKECNIMVGIKILKDNYDKYKNGISAKTLEAYCPQSQYPDRYKKYINYRNDYAAIRAYNGWGCRPEGGCQKACENSKNPPACIQTCVDGTVNYVEKVKDRASGIKGGTIVDKSGIQSILASEDVQSVRDEAEAYYQKPSPPGNIQAKQNEGTPITVTISWTKSSSANVVSYSVSRDSDGEPIRNVNDCDSAKEDKGAYSCVDSTGGLASGKKYRYFVTAYDNNGQYGEGAYEILIV